MDQADHTSDERIVKRWYAYVAEQPGSVGSWLHLVQERLNLEPDQLRHEFGANDEQFLRLRGMRLPRPNHFSEDAQRIALACELDNPFAFTKAMLLARGIAGTANMVGDTGPNTTRTTDSHRVAEHREQYYMAISHYFMRARSVIPLVRPTCSRAPRKDDALAPYAARRARIEQAHQQAVSRVTFGRCLFATQYTQVIRRGPDRKVGHPDNWYFESVLYDGGYVAWEVS